MTPIIPGIIASSDGHQPGTPIIVSATAPTATTATVNFTAPTYLGKPAGTSYTATSSPGALTGTGTGTPITVSGLTPSTAYTFTVTLSNGVGTSLASGTASATTPAAGPFFPPFFPFFPFFPPAFPFFPFFPPKFAQKCIHGDARVLTTSGYMAARDIKVGDKLLTVSENSMTKITPTFHDMSISNKIEFVEVEVTTNNISQEKLIKFNNTLDKFSLHQPIYVKTENGIDWKPTGEVMLGDVLVNVNSESGNISYTIVENIEIFDAENVYEIRTTPLLWFIVGNYLVVS